MNYLELAQTVSPERQLLALDLAENLDAITNKLIQLEPGQKEYCSLMRIFLVAQKQFENLLPPQTVTAPVDALAEFNAP